MADDAKSLVAAPVQGRQCRSSQHSDDRHGSPDHPFDRSARPVAKDQSWTPPRARIAPCPWCPIGGRRPDATCCGRHRSDPFTNVSVDGPQPDARARRPERVNMRGSSPLSAIDLAGSVWFLGESRLLLSGCGAGLRQVAFVGASASGPGARRAMTSRISVTRSSMSLAIRSVVRSAGSGIGSSASASTPPRMSAKYARAA